MSPWPKYSHVIVRGYRGGWEVLALSGAVVFWVNIPVRLRYGGSSFCHRWGDVFSGFAGGRLQGTVFLSRTWGEPTCRSGGGCFPLAWLVCIWLSRRRKGSLLPVVRKQQWIGRVLRLVGLRRGGAWWRGLFQRVNPGRLLVQWRPPLSPPRLVPHIPPPPRSSEPKAMECHVFLHATV